MMEIESWEMGVVGVKFPTVIDRRYSGTEMRLESGVFTRKRVARV
jgi:hypothetical protein